MSKIVKITKIAGKAARVTADDIIDAAVAIRASDKAARVAGNVKVQGAAAKPSSFATACGKASDKLKTEARADAAGREKLRATMAGLVAVAAKGNMARADAGKILAEAVGLSSLSKVRKVDGHPVGAEAWIISLVNAWQFAAKDLQAREQAKKAPKVQGGADSEGSDKAEKADDRTEITTAADMMTAINGFCLTHKAERSTLLEMIGATFGLVKYIAPRAAAKLVAVK